MKIISKHQRQAHEDRLALLKRQHDELIASLESEAPSPMTVQRHGKDEPPLEVSSGIFVMPGDYYCRDGNQSVVIAAADVGPDGAWEEIR